jgi:hypothetical protein
VLKLLACLFMLLDHVGYYFYDLLPPLLVLLLRTIGRLAFPIFAWSVARGFSRTRNPLIYFVRMAGFALLAEVIIRWGNYLAGISLNWQHPDWTNVLITFTLAIAMLSGYRLTVDSYHDMIASLRPIPAAPNTVPVRPHFHVRINLGGISLDPHLGLTLGILLMLSTLPAVELMKADYGIYGLLTVLFIYIAQHHIPEERWEGRAFTLLTILNLAFMIYRLTNHVEAYWATLQVVSIMAIPICIHFRNERKPPVWAKYGFYLFYPLHILVLCLIRAYIM